MAGKTKLKIFISHSHNPLDAALAGGLLRILALALHLKVDEIRCTSQAGHDLPGGYRVDDSLRHDLNEAALVIVILSKASLRSTWVMFELGGRWAINKPLKLLLAEDTSTDEVPEPFDADLVYQMSHSQLWKLIEDARSILKRPLQPRDAIAEELQKFLSTAGTSAAISTTGYGWHRDVPDQIARQPRSLSAVFKQETKAFAEYVRTAKRPISDDVRQWLIAARYAIDEVADVFERNWQRGRHRLEGIGALPRFRWDLAEYSSLSDEIVERILGVLHNLPSHLICRVTVDDFHKMERASSQRPVNNDYIWVIDAIDGSRHLLRHLPLFASTLALVDRNYNPVLSMVYVPVTGELYFAAHKCGSYLNNWDTPLDLRGEKPLMEAMVHLEFPNSATSQTEFEDLFDVTRRAFRDTYRVRGLGLGSLGLAYTAKGAFDAYISVASATKKYDVLAGELLVREAGGCAHPENCGPHDTKERARTGVHMIAGRCDVVRGLLAFPEIAKVFPSARL